MRQSPTPGSPRALSREEELELLSLEEEELELELELEGAEPSPEPEVPATYDADVATELGLDPATATRDASIPVVEYDPKTNESKVVHTPKPKGEKPSGGVVGQVIRGGKRFLNETLQENAGALGQMLDPSGKLAVPDPFAFGSFFLPPSMDPTRDTAAVGHVDLTPEQQLLGARAIQSVSPFAAGSVGEAVIEDSPVAQKGAAGLSDKYGDDAAAWMQFGAQVVPSFLTNLGTGVAAGGAPKAGQAAAIPFARGAAGSLVENMLSTALGEEEGQRVKAMLEVAADPRMLLIAALTGSIPGMRQAQENVEAGAAGRMMELAQPVAEGQQNVVNVREEKRAARAEKKSVAAEMQKKLADEARLQAHGTDTAVLGTSTVPMRSDVPPGLVPNVDPLQQGWLQPPRNPRRYEVLNPEPTFPPPAGGPIAQVVQAPVNQQAILTQMVARKRLLNQARKQGASPDRIASLEREITDLDQELAKRHVVGAERGVPRERNLMREPKQKKVSSKAETVVGDIPEIIRPGTHTRPFDLYDAARLTNTPDVNSAVPVELAPHNVLTTRAGADPMADFGDSDGTKSLESLMAMDPESRAAYMDRLTREQSEQFAQQVVNLQKVRPIAKNAPRHKYSQEDTQPGLILRDTLDSSDEAQHFFTFSVKGNEADAFFASVVHRKSDPSVIYLDTVRENTSGALETTWDKNANALGPRVIQMLARDLAMLFPQATKLEANRTSGANPRAKMSVNLALLRPKDAAEVKRALRVNQLKRIDVEGNDLLAPSDIARATGDDVETVMERQGLGRPLSAEAREATDTRVQGQVNTITNPASPNLLKPKAFEKLPMDTPVPGEAGKLMSVLGVDPTWAKRAAKHLSLPEFRASAEGAALLRQHHAANYLSNREAQRINHFYRKALKELTPAQRQMVDRFMQQSRSPEDGPKVGPVIHPAQLPPHFQRLFAESQKAFTAIEAELIAAGKFTPGQLQRIQNRRARGLFWIHRDYMARMNKTWRPPENIQAQARNFFKQKHGIANDAVAQQLVDEFMSRQQEGGRPRRGYIPNPIITKTLQNRQQWPKVLRQLAGEIEDPAYSMAASHAELLRMYTQHKAVEGIASPANKGALWSDTITPGWAVMEDPFLSPEENQRRFGSLYKKYVVPEIFEGLMDAQPENMDAYTRGLADRVVSIFKASKVGLSPLTYTRNFISNTLYATAANLPPYAPRTAKRLYQAVVAMSDYGRHFHQQHPKGTALPKEAQWLQIAMERGAVRPGTGMEFGGAALRNLASELRETRAGALGMWDVLVKNWDRGFGKLGQVYDSLDIVWRLAAFIENTERYVQRGLPVEVAYDKASAMVNRTFASASTAPPFVRELSQRGAGAFAPFMTWHVDNLRVQANLFADLAAAKDLLKNPSDPDAREALGRPLRVGATMAGIAATFAFLRYYYDLTDEEVEEGKAALRESTMRNSGWLEFLPWRDAQGRLQVVDLTSIVPLATLNKGPEDWNFFGRAMFNGVMGIFGGGYAEPWLNKGLEKAGVPVPGYKDPPALPGQGAWPLLNEMYEFFEPGFARDVRRVYHRSPDMRAGVAQFIPEGVLQRSEMDGIPVVDSPLAAERVPSVYQEQFTPMQAYNRLPLLGNPLAAFNVEPVGEKTQGAKALEYRMDMQKLDAMMRQAEKLTGPDRVIAMAAIIKERQRLQEKYAGTR